MNQRQIYISKGRFILAIFFPILLAACSNTYNRVETGGTERTGVHLDESVAVLVTTPKDGGYNGKLSIGSGAIVARRTDAAFSRYARLVDVYPSEFHSLNELKDTIAKNGYGYIVVPTIAVWEHETSDWADTPSQVSVKISVIDATTGKEISSNFLEAKGEPPSSIYSLLGLGDEGPEELLSDMANGYVDDLYGVILSIRKR